MDFIGHPKDFLIHHTLSDNVLNLYPRRHMLLDKFVQMRVGVLHHLLTKITGEVTANQRHAEIWYDSHDMQAGIESLAVFDDRRQHIDPGTVVIQINGKQDIFVHDGLH